MRDFLDPYGFKMPEIVGTTAGFSAQYQTVYDSFAVKPAADIATQQDTLVRALVSAGVWSTRDAFYITANNDRANSLVNWINPGTYDLLEVNGPIAFVAYRGFTGNGTNQVLNSQFNPTAAAGNYALNSASTSFYCRTNISRNQWELGANEAGLAQAIHIIIRYGDGNAYLRINSTNFDGPVVNANSQGYYVASRTAVNNPTLYKNGVAIINGAVNSTAICNENIFFLGYNNNSVPAGWSTQQMACGDIGAGLSQAEVTAATNAIETYMDYVGAGVA